ncbi:MAG: hypothetical protein HY075_07235 [Deltaproteobacteria bacterium]|nr:hypothetical protein [Deltaproteobacteria bacterium]
MDGEPGGKILEHPLTEIEKRDLADVEEAFHAGGDACVRTTGPGNVRGIGLLWDEPGYGANASEDLGQVGDLCVQYKQPGASDKHDPLRSLRYLAWVGRDEAYFKKYNCGR